MSGANNRQRVTIPLAAGPLAAGPLAAGPLAAGSASFQSLLPRNAASTSTA